MALGRGGARFRAGRVCVRAGGPEMGRGSCDFLGSGRESREGVMND